MLADYPLADLIKLRWSLDCEVLRRTWWIFPIVAATAIVIILLFNRK
jgi:hypothetical protein